MDAVLIGKFAIVCFLVCTDGPPFLFSAAVRFFLLTSPEIALAHISQAMSKAIVLFSGGLDSILAARMLQEQGVETLCVHFFSPFFGDSGLAGHWKRQYGLDVSIRDIGQKFIEMLASGPAHGFGKNLNPCVDCKILIFTEAKRIMEETGADFLCSGEVVGQRPMSQRRDTLNLIQNRAGIAGLLLRPLSARLLEPTLPERLGWVDREKLGAIGGRGRTGQLELARAFNLNDYPSPAGGCKLTEKENVRRYWQILKNAGKRSPLQLQEDFLIMSGGRVLFHPEGQWLVLGRNRADNRRLATLATPRDALFHLLDFPGPLGLARDGQAWPAERIREAGEILASYAPGAVNGGGLVIIVWKDRNGEKHFDICPRRHEEVWGVPAWSETHEELKAWRKSQLERNA